MLYKVDYSLEEGVNFIRHTGFFLWDCCLILLPAIEENNSNDTESLGGLN